jgi:hypothetical protein
LDKRGKRVITWVLISTRKEKINKFGKPFKEKRNIGRKKKIQSTNQCEIYVDLEKEMLEERKEREP